MNPFVHVELSTRDVKAAKKFYQGLFDWKLSDVPIAMKIYTMVDTGGQGGSIVEKTYGGTEWLPYVQVDDVRRTIAKAEKRGAQVIVEYRLVPGMGALGIFVDPGGAKLGVWESLAPAPKAKAKTTKAKAKKK